MGAYEPLILFFRFSSVFLHDSLCVHSPVCVLHSCCKNELEIGIYWAISYLLPSFIKSLDLGSSSSQFNVFFLECIGNLNRKNLHRSARNLFAMRNQKHIFTYTQIIMFAVCLECMCLCRCRCVIVLYPCWKFEFEISGFQ